MNGDPMRECNNRQARRVARWGAATMLLMAGLTLDVDVKASSANGRDLSVRPKAASAPAPVAITGTYWALIIGIDQYQQAPKLETAVRDATAVRDVLVARYGFAREHLVTLLNAQATRSNVEEAFYQLGRQAGPDDSVLIYYAGHGQYDAEGRLGWWVPVDAQPTHPGTFITNASIRDYISGMKAKHVYLVADSCFSGTLFGSRALPPLTDQWVARLYQKPSRWGLTSGSAEPVADRGKDGHSVFAYHFLTLLKENTEPYLVPSQIHTTLAPLVANNSDQTPRSEPLKGAGDEGGQFVFRLASVTSGATPTRPSAPSLSAPSPSTGVSQAEQELRDLEAQEQALDAQTKQAELQRQIEAKKKRLEEKQHQLQVASLPSYSQPNTLGSGEITGQDGAPMRLVPAGEFLYGDNKERRSLPAFYLDTYEVSTRLYAAFLQATGRAQPPDWSPQVALVGSGDRPVVQVDWPAADAYCRWAGKRLPTEQEWEKAARGTDGRLYPWGNEAPTSRHANFDQSWVDNYWTRLAVVGSHAAGASPYGIQDLAGNVWEWTSSDDDSQNKVLRGGSWSGVPVRLRSANRSWGSASERYASIGFRCAQDLRN